MGLWGESNSIATVFGVEVKSDTFTKARISISKKDKETGEWEQELSKWVCFFGTMLAKKAATLKDKDRIRIKKFEIINKFDKESNPWREFETIKIWDFEKLEPFNSLDTVVDDSVDAGNGEVSEDTAVKKHEEESSDDLPW